MSTSLRIVMAQANLLVGDVAGNAECVKTMTRRAVAEHGAELVLFPELTLTGYPPEDLLNHSGLRKRVERALDGLLAFAPETWLGIGYPEYGDAHIYNVFALLKDGRIQAKYRKQLLPNYGVFDEKRYFTPADECLVTGIKGIPVGLTVCEDLWYPGVAERTRDAGAKILLNISASPFQIGREAHRDTQVLAARVRECGLPIVYCNLVGGQDELVFDGNSLAINANAKVAARAPYFVQGLYPVDASYDGERCEIAQGDVHTERSLEESVYRALVFGVRDYVEKNGFNGVIIGLSGGIDSALTLAIAVDAIGADRVTAVMMPSRYTSDLSRNEAARQAEMLGVEYFTLPIEAPFEAFREVLAPVFGDAPADTTEENIQARARGVLLMALSNKTGKMVLTTGNKSEYAVGYATLYGDMAGGFAPLKDVYKLLVFRLARYRNTLSPAIPEAVIERPPSAELRADQKDSDSLPPYEILDPILEAYIEDDLGFDEIVARGFDAAIVSRVLNLVSHNEYKRRQAPPGIKISRRAFGRERRYPITSGYRHALKD
ncbi:MAG TPA: NAD+ synthase [Gammaproteobacteria bacterium]